MSRFLFLAIALASAFGAGAAAIKKQGLLAKPINASEAGPERAILCDDKKPRLVKVAFGRLTVINFPFKPKEVVPGEASFDFRQIKSDLIVKALRINARTNALVYLDERRCAFDFVAVPSGGDDILVVRDPKESQMEAP